MQNTAHAKPRIPMFFACDNNYIPYLAVTLASIEAHASDEYEYEAFILTEGFCEKRLSMLLGMNLPHVRIRTVDVGHRVEEIREKLSSTLRDYYSVSIFYRLFIPSLFKGLNRALYLDCDIVLNDDIAKLYFEDIGDNILGAVSDETIPPIPVFKEYTERVVGMPEGKYFNSGVLLINAKRFREEKIEEKFLHLLNRYNFKTVAPDQDYLNFLCKGMVHYFDIGWNKMPHISNGFDNINLHLVHFNMFEKPWKYNGVLYSELFWGYARRTPFYAHIASSYENYTNENRKRDQLGAQKLLESAAEITADGCSFAQVLGSDVFKEVKL